MEAPRPIHAALVRLGLASEGETLGAEPLAGGVSSDIWRIDLERGPVCVKLALPRLKVAAVWEAPVERNAFEYAWLTRVGERFPAIVPELLGRDATAQLFVMRYLDPSQHAVWKSELAAGRVEPGFAAAVGEALAGIHSSTADRSDIAAEFATDASFRALRIEPYLLATAARYADTNRVVAERLRTLAEITAATHRVLVHGDVSPKNVLCGPQGPIFLDAECAWFGDPAFDLAFCLNHLMLKTLWVPREAAALRASFDALSEAYLDRVTWEPRAALDARTAALLPGLFLARVDGKSPVEYLTLPRQHDAVRLAAIELLSVPRLSLASVADYWWRSGLQKGLE